LAIFLQHSSKKHWQVQRFDGMTVQHPADLPGLMPEVFRLLGGRRKIALYGPMGAGKTTFTKAFCQALGVTEPTGSPTYSLINQYRYTTPDGQTALLHHLDLYRLESAGEVLEIGVEDLLYDPWYCLIEWPQLIEPILPPDTAKIHLQILTETARQILLL
jgi:tRNA threonylcarbamoyladenosine biosynthesis protein TsaE